MTVCCPSSPRSKASFFSSSAPPPPPPCFPTEACLGCGCCQYSHHCVPCLFPDPPHIDPPFPDASHYHSCHFCRLPAVSFPAGVFVSLFKALRTAPPASCLPCADGLSVSRVAARDRGS
jgi:hypothetical protein